MSCVPPATPIEPGEPTAAFYVDAMRRLDEAGVPFLVGGGYAMAFYTGIRRNTKDLDLFVRHDDHARALETLARAGYQTEYFYRFWIAKALSGDDFVDILYNSGNGVCVVDDAWFEHSQHIDVLGHPARIVPAEEQLWSKAFVQDRDRFDGADVIHLMLRQRDALDWPRLVRRFRGHEAVLLGHVIMLRYAYPGEREAVPQWVFQQLLEASEQSSSGDGSRVCMGGFVAQKSYTVAFTEWGYLDGRLQPNGPLSLEERNSLPK